MSVLRRRRPTKIPSALQCTLPTEIPDPPAELIGDAVENNPEQKNLRRQAETFVSTHPHIYRLFVKFAKQRSKTGKPFGMKLLAERVRWECGLLEKRKETGGIDDDEYLLNNNHTAYIARRLVADYPELTTLLRFRKTRY